MLSFTLDANAIRPDASEWRPEVATLIDLSRDCSEISVGRTRGALRERSHPPGDPEAERRRDLMLSVPGVTEAFTIPLSHLDDEESVLAADWEPEAAAWISDIVFGRPVARLRRSDLEDVTHLLTHLRNGRDVFVTTDEKMLASAPDLMNMGIRVATPRAALAIAQDACAGAGGHV